MSNPYSAPYSRRRDRDSQRCLPDIEKKLSNTEFQIDPSSYTNGTSADYKGIDGYTVSGNSVQLKAIKWKGFSTITLTTQEKQEKYHNLPSDTLLIHSYYEEECPSKIIKLVVIKMRDLLTITDEHWTTRTNRYTGTSFSFVYYKDLPKDKVLFIYH